MKLRHLLVMAPCARLMPSAFVHANVNGALPKLTGGFKEGTCTMCHNLSPSYSLLVEYLVAGLLGGQERSRIALRRDGNQDLGPRIQHHGFIQPGNFTPGT